MFGISARAPIRLDDIVDLVLIAVLHKAMKMSPEATGRLARILLHQLANNLLPADEPFAAPLAESAQTYGKPRPRFNDTFSRADADVISRRFGHDRCTAGRPADDANAAGSWA
jgi:hypothetical protein